MSIKKQAPNQLNAARVIAIASGKGGVGKTNISVNLAMAMSELNYRVTLMDADLGLANVDVLLGLHPLRNLSHVIKGECGLEDILVNGPGDIHIIPAASGIKMMNDLSLTQHAALVHAFDELVDMTDFLVIDTCAGLADSVMSFCSAAQEVIVVVCNEPASIADAYALIKVLNREHEVTRFHVLVNMVQDAGEGRQLFSRLVKVTEQFLDVVLDFMGVIPRDQHVIKALQRQRPLLSSYPSSPAALAFKELAKVADKWPKTSQANGRLEFFMDSMVRSESANVYGGGYE